MDDVLRHVVLTPGDENLGTGNVERAVVIGFGLGADNAQVGACMGFGQIHGTGPDAGVHVGKVLFFQLLAAVGVQGEAGTGSQHRREAKGHIGSLHHLFKLGYQSLGHTHAAELRVTAQTVPATFNDGLVGFLETFGGSHFAIVPLGALLVTLTVQRREDATGNLPGLFQNGIGGIRVNILRHFRQGCPQGGCVKNLVQNETHVT